MIHRDDIGNFLNLHGLKGIGLELGVQTGEFSKQILSQWHGKMLYLIDCWEKQENYIDIANKDNVEQNRNYKKTIKNTKPYEKRVKIIKSFSKEAVCQFEDNFFDFIYIDANHSYDAVKEDLEVWWSKLKPKGLFCGHDFFDGDLYNTSTNEFLGNFGVKKAVSEFAANNDSKVFSGPCSSWYFFKKAKMKIGFVNVYDKSFEQLANLTIKNKKDYCEKHGYDFIEYTNDAPLNKHVAFNKFKSVLQNLTYYDWIFYNDVDSLIMNYNIKIEDFIDNNYEFIITYDINGINSGQWLIKNTDWALNFINKVYNRNEFDSFGTWADQIALCNTWLYSGEAMQKTKVVPQKLFNSYLYENFGKNDQGESPRWPQGQFKTGDFCLHLCGLDFERRKAYIEKYLPQVIN